MEIADRKDLYKFYSVGIHGKKVGLIVFCMVFLLLCVTYTLRVIGIADQYPEFVAVFFLFICSVSVVLLTCASCTANSEIIIILSAYIVHLVVLLVDLYAKDYVTILHSGLDSEGFYRYSKQFYEGDISAYQTWYPFVLNGIYQFVGLNRFIAQYMNILFWFVGIIIVKKSCILFDIQRRYCALALLLFGFFPNYLCLTSILMRESMISFFVIFSYYYFLKWMRMGKIYYICVAFISLVPGIILHTSVITLWMGYGFAYAFYHIKKNKIRLQYKSFFVVGIGLLACFALISVPVLKKMLLAYIPIPENGMIPTINTLIEVRKTVPGGSDYLVSDVYINNYLDLIWYTIMRMINFLWSPVPCYWRGLQDVGAFLLDSLFYLIALLVCMWSILKKKREPYRTMFLVSVMLYALLCAWGVNNAGTAMRHRDKIIGVVILMLVYSWQVIKRKRGKSLDD